MQCNQSSCGNGFTNGPFCNNPYIAPLECNLRMYPEIVGEGEVTSVTLPDGNTQFFFIPTVKWWSPNAFQCHPIYPNANPMFANMNYNFQSSNNNLGAWFVRTISNPPPQNMFYPPSQRNEFPRLNVTSDCNMNINNNTGYQVKFHNDNSTSTTDLQYFYPSLRQYDYMAKLACTKGTATVQINTAPLANTMCHYEVICTKPCHYSIDAKPMSLESLVTLKPPTKTKSATDGSFVDKKNNKRENEEHKTRSKSNKADVCACESEDKIVSVDKSVKTYKDEGCSCVPVVGRETQTVKNQSKGFKKLPLKPSCKKYSPLQLSKDDRWQELKEAETEPMAPMNKRAMNVVSSGNMLDSRWNECDGGCQNCSSYSR